MGEGKVELSNFELLIRYMLKKCYEGLGTEVSADEFNDFVSSMFSFINKNQGDCPFYMKDQDFETTCKEVLEFAEKGYEIKDSKLCATYDLIISERSGGRVNGLYKAPYQISNYMMDFFNKKQKEALEKVKINDNNLDSFSAETIMRSKQISAYIVNDLINRYVNKQIKDHYWPSHCYDIDKWFFEKDLASFIELPGNRLVFMQLYNHSVRTVAEMLSNDPKLIISNNDKICLAYNNFRKIVAPFPFILSYKYSEYHLNNNEITIKVENNVADLKEVKCIYSDPYDEWSNDYKSKKSILSSDQSAEFEGKLMAFKKR